jgi:hypothetical protein
LSLPPISLADPRRQVGRKLMQAFNSSDAMTIAKCFASLFVEEDEHFLAIHRYNGPQNPFGRNVNRFHGREMYADLWRALIQSSPDFLFEQHEPPRCFYDEESLALVVATQYTWFGTRIHDLCVRREGHATESIWYDTQHSQDRLLGGHGESFCIGSAINSGNNNTHGNTSNSNSKVALRCSGTMLVSLQTSLKMLSLEYADLQRQLAQSMTPCTVSATGSGGIALQKKLAASQRVKIQQRLQELQREVLRDADTVGKVFKLEFVYSSAREKIVE